MAKKIFNVNPPVNVEIVNFGALDDVVIRVDIGVDNTWDVTFDFFGAQGGWEAHGVRIMQAAGRDDITTPTHLAAILNAKTKTEVDAMVKAAWNAMLQALCDFINLKWFSADIPTQPTDKYTTAEEFITAQLMRTQVSVVNGKIVLSIP